VDEQNIPYKIEFFSVFSFRQKTRFHRKGMNNSWLENLGKLLFFLQKSQVLTAFGQ
jgi:hypothetical protein